MSNDKTYDEALSDVENKTLCGAIAVVHRFTSVTAIREMRRRGIENSYPPYLMAVAFREGSSQDDIARELHIDKGQVAKVTKKLVASGYIDRRRDDDDKRMYRLYLTEKGRATVPQISKLNAMSLADIKAALTEEEFATYDALTRKIADFIINSKADCHIFDPCVDHDRRRQAEREIRLGRHAHCGPPDQEDDDEHEKAHRSHDKCDRHSGHDTCKTCEGRSEHIDPDACKDHESRNECGERKSHERRAGPKGHR